MHLNSPRERVWLFDLDNTLHEASPHIFPHINRAMGDYIARHLGVDRRAASQLRQHYWERYGATLRGLMRHHDVDPRHFLWHTHQFPDLPAMVVFDPAVRAMLGALPGRKLVFSNAPRHYTEQILNLTGLRRRVQSVYTVEDLRFQPKPLRGGFRRLLRAEGLDPRRCILVEDSLANLITAKALGMTTVWITPSLRNHPAVDYRLRRTADLIRLGPRLGLALRP